MTTDRPALIICMGTSGCGKSSIGLAVAQALSIPFVDGDDLHPASNVAKMSSGNPLTDADRIPWLLRIRKTAQLLASPAGEKAARQSPSERSVSPELEEALTHVHSSIVGSKSGSGVLKRDAVVIGCSALKVSYRDLLRGKEVESFGVTENTEKDLETFFVYLHGTRTLLLNRMTSRPSHFFKPSMLDSQLATLEPPSPETESNVNVVKLGKQPDEVEEVGVEGVVKLSTDAVVAWLG